MDNAGAQELLMSALIPGEILKESGRWDVFGPEMFRLKDRNERDFCLGPTHEEIFTDAVKGTIKSYKSLPVYLYQIQTKYRDERRPRFGVMRSREFIMKDAYSFDRDDEGLDLSYKSMYKAYSNIFDRLALNYTVVQADSGAMGGSGSQEFMVTSEIGEDAIAVCKDCNYAANDEKAECIIIEKADTNEEMLPLEEISTPDIKTIDDLTGFLKVDAKKIVKTIIYKADNEIVAVLIRGDSELNETKLKNYLGVIELEMADENDIKEATLTEVGFAGPINIKARLIIDINIPEMKNFVIGANKKDTHLINANYERDFASKEIIDLRTIQENDICPECGGSISIARGIEVGHIFKLGTKYSEKLGCSFLDENGKSKPMIMGCYGIGVNRSMAAIIEQNNDENGIIWPKSVAPYHAIVIPVNIASDPQRELAEELYEKLKAENIDVLLDDRKERAGVKFKDADLIGIPYRINIGRKAEERIVEFKERKGGEILELSAKEAVLKIVSGLKE
jgi:prolyl-tRNA synthetase